MRLRIAFIADMSLVDGTRQANDEGSERIIRPFVEATPKVVCEQAAWQANDE
jgi:hypothetical protein